MAKSVLDKVAIGIAVVALVVVLYMLYLKKYKPNTYAKVMFDALATETEARRELDSLGQDVRGMF